MVCCLPPMNPGLGTPGSIDGSWCVFLTLGPMFLAPAPARVPVSRRGTGWTPGARCGTMGGLRANGSLVVGRGTGGRGVVAGSARGERRTSEGPLNRRPRAGRGVPRLARPMVPWSGGLRVRSGEMGGYRGVFERSSPQKERGGRPHRPHRTSPRRPGLLGRPMSLSRPASTSDPRRVLGRRDPRGYSVYSTVVTSDVIDGIRGKVGSRGPPPGPRNALDGAGGVWYTGPDGGG
jgi:hypothetical protein